MRYRLVPPGARLAEIKESRASSDDPVAFTEAQGLTFMVLLPLLAASIVVSLIGRKKRRPGEPAAVPVEAPLASSRER